ncbi:DUF423 domain-containing protein [Desulfosediminicola flagellatus]|uniref:DUF423 domain-containing protein n=1 Tax=Desulfosediminicola flagellatus TaxID=2569541 RepID=UPI0010AD0492|nr:DUF423 domain-containing protein [Desulfosediminicola flagellatus]
MTRFFFTTGAVLAGLAIAIGAATGHQPSTYDETIIIWLEKATRYQFYHGLALLGVAIALHIWKGQQTLLNLAGFCFIAGVLLFSGSLYLMAFSGISAGYITPFGGMAFLAGWLAMALAGVKLSEY